MVKLFLSKSLESFKTPVDELMSKTIISSKANERPLSVLAAEDIIKRKQITQDDGLPTRSLSPPKISDDMSYSTSNSTKSIERGKLRDMLEVIKRNAQKSLPPPEFVQKIDEIPLNVSIWPSANQRMGSEHRPRKLQVMGCQQSIDIILALADDRARKQKHAMEIKQKICDDKVKYISQLIEAKRSRGQRLAQRIEDEQCQRQLLRMLCLVRFVQSVRPVYLFLCKRNRIEQQQSLLLRGAGGLSESVLRRVRQWQSRARTRKYVHFLSRMAKHKWMFMLHIRILRKTRAANILRTCLTEKSDNEKRVSTTRWS